MTPNAILGTDSFIDYIYDRFLADRDIEKKKRVKIENLRSRLETPEEIAESVAEVFGVKDEKELFQKYTRNRYARSVFLELSRKYLGAKMSNVELGRQFGNMSGAAINENRKRIQEVIKKNKEVRKLYQKAEKKLKTRLI